MRAILLAAVMIRMSGPVGAIADDAGAVAKKLDFIEHGHPPRGSRILFARGEINRWILDQAKARAPRGARNLRLDLQAGKATGYADLDFLKLRHAVSGEAPGWLLRNLLAGERPVRVSAHFESRNGRARVDVDRVEISGVVIEGRALEFLIDNFVRPMFPYAVVDDWFDLHYGVDRFTVSPAGIVVFIGSGRATAIQAFSSKNRP